MQGQKENIGFCFMEAAAGWGDRTAICSPRGTVSYAKLERAVELYALHMQRHGIDKNACVALHITLLPNSIAATLAVALLGARWIHASPETVEHKTLAVTHLFYDSDKAPFAAPGAIKPIRMDDAWRRPPAGAGPLKIDDFPGYGDPDETLFITHSSGTTGTRKFMCWSFSMVMQWQRFVPDVQYPEKAPVIANLFPMLSILGWFYNLSALMRGGTLVFHNRYDYFAAQGVSHIIGSPQQFARLLENQAPPGRPLPITVHVTGGPVSDSLLDKMARFFKSALAIYGSTEAGPVCIRELTAARRAGERSLGRPINGVNLRILDEAGREVPPGHPGIVAIQTPLLVEGYIGDAEATEQAFCDGWFYPGDIGKLTSEGEFVVIGRSRDQLNLGGVKANAADIDETIQSPEAVSDAICFHQAADTGADILAAVVRLKTDADPEKTAAEIRAACKKRHGRDLTPRSIYFLDHVPRNENGKPLRRECGELIKGLKAW